MGATYHQFCPVAKAMELLDERWTLLIIRELVTGSEHFNELRRGVPTMSPSLLSKRLQQLERAGIVQKAGHANHARYVLTPAGRDLRPVVEAVGTWGIRWIGELGDEDLDPKLLLWDMHRNIIYANVPPGRTVIHFSFPDVRQGRRHWWLVINPEEVDVCDTDPGYPVTVTVTTKLRTMVQIWRGDREWREASATGELQIEASATNRRACPTWFALSSFARVSRPSHAPTQNVPPEQPTPVIS